MAEVEGSGVAFVDGAFVPLEDATVSVFDFGFEHGDATYDVVHVWKRKFFRLDAHLDRFEWSMERLSMNPGYSRSKIVDVLRECVLRSGLDDAYVEMICTRGQAKRGARDPREAKNRFLAFSIPFVWIVTPEQSEHGFDMAVSSVRRIPPESVDPTIKNYHWLDMTAALFDAYDLGHDTTVLIDGAGGITEGPGFNVFVVEDGRVATPARGVLHGITRQTALELCERLGIDAEARPVTVEELRRADEVFATSTAGGVMAIGRIDGRSVGNATPGPVTRRITDAYWASHDDPDWTTPID